MKPRRDAKDYQSLCVSYLPARNDSLDRQEKKDIRFPMRLYRGGQDVACGKWGWCGVV